MDCTHQRLLGVMMGLLWLAATATGAPLRSVGPSPLLASYPQALMDDLDGILHVTRDDGTTLLQNITGNQNIEYNSGMTSASRFLIGSNSKLYTTVALYQLQEEGKFKMTDDVASLLTPDDFVKFALPGQARWCPQLPNSSICQVITVRQLLSMSSGIYPALNCIEPFSECREDVFVVNPGSIGYVVGTFINSPLIFTPGSAYHYSNPNFVLGAYLVEKFSGTTFQAYLNARILGPLGLEDTYFDFFNNQLGQVDLRRTSEYLKFYDNVTFERIGYSPLRTELDTGAVSGTGGLISTPFDEARFYRAVFNKTSGGAPLLRDPSSQAALLAPNTFMEMSFFNNTQYYTYYTQGIVVLCQVEECVESGPDFIAYMGGTLGSHTANIYDYRSGRGGLLSQVWTSSNQYLVSRSVLNEVRASQIGSVIDFVGQWTAGTPDQMNLGWELLAQYS